MSALTDGIKMGIKEAFARGVRKRADEIGVNATSISSLTLDGVTNLEVGDPVLILRIQTKSVNTQVIGAVDSDEVMAFLYLWSEAVGQEMVEAFGRGRKGWLFLEDAPRVLMARVGEDMHNVFIVVRGASG